MATIKASRDQFRLDGNKVHHEPTGAWWSAYPDQDHASFMNAGRLFNIQVSIFTLHRAVIYSEVGPLL